MTPLAPRSSRLVPPAVVQAEIARRRATVDHSAEFSLWRSDIAAFCEGALWQYDPQPDEAGLNDRPMKLWPFQRDYLAWLERRYQSQGDGLVEKSRDMWATWGILAWLLHHWLFDTGFTALVASHNEIKTDNGLIDSLFGRLEYMVNRLPAWLKPPVDRAFCRLVNQKNGNTISGAAPTQQFARQGRYSVIVLDEMAAWGWQDAAETATADASKVRFFLSTPQGANAFKRLRFSGRIPVLTLHWRQHPLKTTTWYEAEKARRTPENIASELDISYDKSVQGRVYPEWEMIKKGDFNYQPGWPLYTSWDFGLDGTALIWWQRNPNGNWRVIDCYSNANKTIDFYVPWCTGVIASGLPYGYTEDDLRQIEEHRGWPGATHFGDPDVAKRNLETGRTTKQILAQHGIHVQTRPDVNSFEARQQATKLFLRKIEGLNMPACTALDDAMMNARFPERSENSQSTGEKVLPIHDWSSHHRTSCEYMAVNEPSPGIKRVPTPIERRGSRVLRGW